METMRLPCALTERELTERRDKLVALLGAKAEAEQEKKDAAAEHKLRIDELSSDIGNVASEIRERSERRPVEVKREKDYVRRIEEVVRLDTGEVVETRALTPAELQGELRLLKETAAQ